MFNRNTLDSDCCPICNSECDFVITGSENHIVPKWEEPFVKVLMQCHFCGCEFFLEIKTCKGNIDFEINYDKLSDKNIMAQKLYDKKIDFKTLRDRCHEDHKNTNPHASPSSNPHEF